MEINNTNIRVVRKGGSKNNNYVTVPTDSDLEVGDLVIIKKVNIEVKE